MIGVNTTVDTKGLRFQEYKRAVKHATVESVRDVAKFVKSDAQRRAPVARVHRVRRRYPRASGIGALYEEKTRLKNSFKTRVRDRGDRGILGRVWSSLGYSVFQEHGTRYMAAKRFLRDARDKNLGKLISILRGRIPKDGP